MGSIWAWLRQAQLSGPGGAVCVVCGRPCGPVAYKSPFGDVWCRDHSDLSACCFCGVPAYGPAGSLCERCSAYTVRTKPELMVGLREVGTFMSNLGLVVEQPTKLVLRDHADLKDSGLLPSPDALGSTKWTYNQSGRVNGELAIVAGLPAAQCQAVIAHEFGHALLAGSQGAQTLASRLAEGFCESLAAAYLTSRQSRREERIALYRIENNPDPVYGDGYRLVAPGVDRHGVRRVLAALRAGDPGQVGLRA